MVKLNVEAESNGNRVDDKEYIQRKLEITGSNLDMGNKPSPERIRVKRSVEPKVTPSPKKKNIFISGLKIAERFIVEHPVESIEIASVVIEVTVKAISSIRGKDVRSRSTKI